MGIPKDHCAQSDGNGQLRASTKGDDDIDGAQQHMLEGLLVGVSGDRLNIRIGNTLFEFHRTDVLGIHELPPIDGPVPERGIRVLLVLPLGASFLSARWLALPDRRQPFSVAARTDPPTVSSSRFRNLERAYLARYGLSLEAKPDQHSDDPHHLEQA
jgi:hypothetical protein